MILKIIAVGKIKQKQLLDLINDYQKQIKELSIIELPDEKSDVGMIKEGKAILSKISEQEFVCVLAIKGQMLTSEELSDFIMKTATFKSNQITFVIGGSYGLSEEVYKRADYQISFSKMTFPHQLMRLMLVEQIYRAMMISKNHPYHK